MDSIQTYDTGELLKKVYAHMCKDSFTATDGLVDYRDRVYILATDLQAFRGLNYPSKCQAPSYVFKWSYQLEALLKRFRFENDAYSDEELETKTFEKFMSVQTSMTNSLPSSAVTRLVLSEARKICKKILGKYSQDECLNFVSFGKNATVGVTRANSLLHERLSKPLSCNLSQRAVFERYLESDVLLKETILRCQRRTNSVAFAQCDVLKLSCVPKSYKAFRGIMPNTELGLFYTAGLGKYIESRLLLEGLYLPKIPSRHKDLARSFSISRTHVTADLSAASDSFSSSVINALVPRDWFTALKLGRITDFSWKNSTYKMSSFMTMGIGFTFPLQTLLFYSLIKAIGKLLGISGVYSVFGDDLIYPRKTHKVVKWVLEKLGFTLNIDKTFVKDYFRESCGGDYYRGIDVRPFQPEGSASRVSKLHYLEQVYKIANGLRLRWEEEEIASTLQMLKKEIASLSEEIHQVPPNFPDSSGWKVDSPKNELGFSRVRVKFLGVKTINRFEKYLQHVGFMNEKIHNPIVEFSYLCNNLGSKRVDNCIPYYWDTTRRASKRHDFTNGYIISPLKWKTIKYRGEKVIRKLVPFIPNRMQLQLQLSVGQVTTWSWG